jgi:hypothetical protein
VSYKKSKLHFLSLALLTVFCFHSSTALFAAQSKSEKSHQAKVNPQREVKSVKPVMEPEPDKKYISSIETANVQLGSSLNRFNLMFGVLSLMVTFLMGVLGLGVFSAAFIIFRHEREYFRNLLQGTLRSLRANHDQVTEQVKKTDNVISNLKSEMKSASQDQKAKLQLVLNQFEAARVSLSKLVPPAPSKDHQDGLLTQTSAGFKLTHKCTHCGSHFDHPPGTQFALEEEFPIECPKCKKIDIVKIAA